MADERLLVYLDGQFVGVLTQNSAGRISFSYDAEYRNRPSAIPLSLSLPKLRADHPPKPVRAFISGLLPDSDRALGRIANRYGVSPRNPFALLRHIGMDAAGAVQILPEEVPPTDAAVRQGDIEWLSSDDVETLLEDLAQSPESWDPGRDTGRWSLAGAQSKVALFRSSEGAWGIPRDSTPTTYILKPSIPDLAGHHLNEYLCLRAAQLAGLPAANSEIFVSDKFEVLISERYDRRNVAGRWARLHQEDTCQALSVAPEMKYQADGGPSVSDIAGLFSKSMTSRTREESCVRFFEYLFYNVAIGAPDAHAKNFSILLGADDARLAPLYDVASILPYDPGNETKSALKIGANWLLSRINAEDWVTTGRQLGLSRDEVVHRTENLRLRIPEALQTAATEPRVPDPLRTRATRIADLVSASLEDKRNQWGDVTP